MFRAEELEAAWPAGWGASHRYNFAAVSSFRRSKHCGGRRNLLSYATHLTWAIYPTLHIASAACSRAGALAAGFANAAPTKYPAGNRESHSTGYRYRMSDTTT